MQFRQNFFQFTNPNPYQQYIPIQNYQEQEYQIPVDNYQQPKFDPNKNQLFYDAQKNTTTGLVTTKITKTITKGRPRKQEKVNTEDYCQILSEHIKTVFGSSLCYASKCLKKQYRKCSKYGFLHKNIAQSNYYYLDINQAIKKNKIISNEYKNFLQKEIQQNIYLYNFLQKLLWIGSNVVIDQILYLISHFFINHIYLLTKYRNLQIANFTQIQEIKKTAKKFAKSQINYIQQKFVYINFKSPQLKLSEEAIIEVELQLLEFIEVLLVSAILSSNNFAQNPYFSIYYTYDEQAQKKKKVEKKQTKKKKKLVSLLTQKKESQEIQLVAQTTYMQKYKQQQNSIQQLNFNQNMEANYLLAFTYGYYNPYNRYYN